MKTKFRSFKMLPKPVVLIFVFSFFGCYPATTELEVSSGGESKLDVVTRSVSGTALEYPLLVYAFDSNGNCKTEKVVESSNDAVKLSLAEGYYRITAIAGSSGLEMPKKITSSAFISTKDGNYSISPLSLGHADTEVVGSSSATIQMSLQAAAIEISLLDIPDNVSAVSVRIARQYSKIGLEGTLSEDAITEIPCKKDDDGWTTGKVYILPTSSETTVFSISITDDSGIQTYGYTYNSKLNAGIPYILRGSFTTGFVFNGQIVSSGWNNEIIVDFNFGPGVNEYGGGENLDEQIFPDASVAETVSSIPAPASMWNGHVVAMVDKLAEKEAKLTLLSVQEWKDVWSANKESNKDDAKNICSAYTEFGLSGWHIPTKEEAESLRALYAGENLPNINNVLEANKVQTLSDGIGQKNVRYLCGDAEYSFSFKAGNTRPSSAGQTVKYLLRLVKTVRVKKE